MPVTATGAGAGAGITAVSESEATEGVQTVAAVEQGPGGDLEDNSSQRHPSGDAGSVAADAELAIRCSAAEAQVRPYMFPDTSILCDKRLECFPSTKTQVRSVYK